MQLWLLSDLQMLVDNGGEVQSSVSQLWWKRNGLNRVIKL